MLDCATDVSVAVSHGRIDLLLLDGSDSRAGPESCRALRMRAVTPLMIVVGVPQRGDAVPWLEAGADDVVVVNRHRELTSRVRAVLRRLPHRSDTGGRITINNVTLDIERHEVTVDERTERLTPKQLALLHLLMSNRSQVVPREVIIRRIWGETFRGSYNVLEVQIRKLRALIEDDPHTPSRIGTVRSVGYTYRA